MRIFSRILVREMRINLRASWSSLPLLKAVLCMKSILGVFPFGNIRRNLFCIPAVSIPMHGMQSPENKGTKRNGQDVPAINLFGYAFIKGKAWIQRGEDLSERKGRLPLAYPSFDHHPAAGDMGIHR